MSLIDGLRALKTNREVKGADLLLTHVLRACGVLDKEYGFSKGQA